MTVTSEAVKSALASLRVKVSVAVSEALSCVLLLLMAMVGKVVSLLRAVSAGQLTFRDTLLSVSAPSALKLPDASENRSEPTTMAALVALAVGVKVAV